VNARRLLGLCAFAIGIYGAAPAAALVKTGSAQKTALTADPVYVESLVQRAKASGLARDPMWLRLVHYRSSVFGGHSSEADARSFFLAEDGKGDPEAELVATLRGFFGPEPKDARLDHPYCRFPARLAWLNSRRGSASTLRACRAACARAFRIICRRRTRAPCRWCSRRTT
jgi:hypothetical protein